MAITTKLVLGNCLERMTEIPDGAVDMILCDLPYGTTSCKWDTVIPFDRLWEQYRRVCKKNAAIVLTASQPFTSALITSNPKAFKHEWIWRKDKAGNFASAAYAPLKVHESIVVFSFGKIPYYPIKTLRDKPIIRGNSSDKGAEKNLKSSSKFGRHTRKVFIDRFPQSVITFGTVRKTCHPTQKPVELMEYLIRTYTKEGELVLDNAMGSGTTGVACVNSRRKFIGIELDSDYFNIAKGRILAAKRNILQSSL
jgi:site-specific DNA-methyltransferase (adenine-specific)